MPNKKPTPKTHATRAATSRRVAAHKPATPTAAAYSPYVYGMVIIFASLSILFAAIAYWRYG